MYYLLDENKNVVESSLEEWCDLIEGRFPTNYNYKHIGDDKIYGKRISTIFIGLNHGCLLHHECNCPPIVFETMIFDENENSIFLKRYSTWKEAEDGHKEAIYWVKNNFKG